MAEQADNDENKDEGEAEEAPAEKAAAKKPKSADKPAPAAKAKKKSKPAGEAKTLSKSENKGDKNAPKRTPPPSSASLGKSMVLFVIVVGTLAAGFALLGQERGSAGPGGPAWKVGDKVDLEITLVASDKRELGCAAADEIAGRHCGSEAPNKPWTKSDNTDDKKILRPYTSTDNMQFVAAGLWSEPALSGTLPATRFTVKCKYTVEGKIKNPTFHWESGWEGQPRAEMHTGLVSDCKMLP